MTTEQSVEEDKIPSTRTIISEGESSESDAETSAETESREDSRFKEGQILRFVRVRFPGNARSFPFLVGKRRIEYGQKVVAMSDRGMAVGYVNSFPYDVPFNKSMLPIRSISKVAGEEDVINDKESYRQQKNAENICNDLIEDFKLDMQLTHVEFTSFGKKAVFYFIAPSRVDFRDLVRDLVGKLKMRIELRQISVRDRSASIGGIGPCGRELCCSSFLTKYGNVGIKMAKNQDLTLNFSKLNGVCGQLKCCLQYEDDVYRDKRSRLPKEGDYITTHTGEMGRVDRLHLLNEQFVMMTDRGIRKRYVVDLYKETLDKETANFPREFESVSDETHKVIGKEDRENKKHDAFEAEIKTYQEKGKSFAEGVFASLFGEKSLGYDLPDVAELTSDKPKVKTPDEEEEIFYTPTEDEILPDDEDEVKYDDVPVKTRVDNLDRDVRDNRGRNDNRAQGRPERQNQGPRPQRNDNRSQGNGPRQDNRGPRREGRSDNRGPRPQNNNNQNRPQGGGQGSNQGRSRPPR